MRSLQFVFAALAVAVALVPAPRSAQGATDAVGNLASGGSAKGDISKRAGETDTITVDLVAGTTVDFRWTPGFVATVGFFDPNQQPVDLGFDGSRAAALSGWPVPATGRYQFRIASADGSQGTYRLSVLPAWDRKLTFEGTGQQTFDVPMPAASTLKGKVEPQPGASNPSILSLLSPADEELLVNPVIGSPGLAKMRPVQCMTQGVYRFTATATAGTQEFVATLKRHTLRIPMTRIDIRNGLDQISYANDGIEDYFDLRCASCHSWASSYAGVRSFATLALGRMRSGSMPQGGPRADAATIDLVAEWIKTGYGR